MTSDIFDSRIYEAAITQWVIHQLQERGIRETHFSRRAGLGKNETDGRTFRKIKQGKRRWSLTDICKAASFFDLTPASLLARVETFYHEYGIMRPESVEKIMSSGVDAGSGQSPLISTWQKKGKNFLLIDTDPAWRQAAREELAVIIGKSSRDIFRQYPAVTKVIEEAWKKGSQASTRVAYTIKTGLEKKLLASEAAMSHLEFRLTAVFVPSEQVVVYAHPLAETA